MGGSTLKHVVLLVVSAIIGIGVMLVGTSLMPGFFDEQMKIVIGIVLTVFAYICFYFMSKSGGS